MLKINQIKLVKSMLNPMVMALLVGICLFYAIRDYKINWPHTPQRVKLLKIVELDHLIQD